MKVVMFFVFFMSLQAFAGSPECTAVTDITTGDSYFADPWDCVIRINRPFSYTDFQVFLPEDTDAIFTVQNNASYEGDHCENYGDELEPFWVCQPRAITVYSLTQGNTVDSSESVTNAGYYLQGTPTRSSDTFTWDNSSNWNVSYDHWNNN